MPWSPPNRRRRTWAWMPTGPDDASDCRWGMRGGIRGGQRKRPDVPDAWVHRLDTIITRFPETTRERAWVGVCWRVRRATIAHVFGGEDQRFRITFRAEAEEVLAFEHLGPPYFRASWGTNVVGSAGSTGVPTGPSSSSCSPIPIACRLPRCWPSASAVPDHVAEPPDFDGQGPARRWLRSPGPG